MNAVIIHTSTPYINSVTGYHSKIYIAHGVFLRDASKGYRGCSLMSLNEIAAGTYIYKRQRRKSNVKDCKLPLFTPYSD